MIQTVDWPQEDLQQLFARIEACIPEKDNLAFSTRVEKLNWEKVGFVSYTFLFQYILVLFRLRLITTLMWSARKRGVLFKKGFAGFEY